MVTVVFVHLNPGLSCGIINQHFAGRYVAQ